MQRSLGVCLVLASMLCLVLARTGLDFIVHHDLYLYGLEFSYVWARPYWNLLHLESVLTGLLAFSAFMLMRPVTRRNLVTGALLFVTFGLIAVNLDLLWFMLGGGLPAADLVWWWYWANDYIPWTTRSQVGFTFLSDLAVALLWTVWHQLTR